MNKEEFLNDCLLCEDLNVIHYAFKQFFDSNICISKGANRHPYADVLHAWIEGAEVEFAFKGSPVWSVYERSNAMQYRIKPSEPVYEWQWLLFGKNPDTYHHCYGLGIGYSIDSEVDEEVYRWVKIEETKRIRG